MLTLDQTLLGVNKPNNTGSLRPVSCKLASDWIKHLDRRTSLFQQRSMLAAQPFLQFAVKRFRTH